MSSSLPVSRRTVARGAAWSVPLVAVSVAAPAFAASVAGPAPVAASQSCKCPGGNSPYIYNLYVNWSTPGDAAWTVTVTQVTFTDNQGTSVLTVSPNTGQTLTGGDGTVRYVLSSQTNSKSTYIVNVSFTATSGGTTVSRSVNLGSVQFNPCAQNICP